MVISGIFNNTDIAFFVSSSIFKFYIITINEEVNVLASIDIMNDFSMTWMYLYTFQWKCPSVFNVDDHLIQTKMSNQWMINL